MLAHYLTSFLKKKKRKKEEEIIHPHDFIKMNYQLKYLFPSELRNKKNDKHVMINIYLKQKSLKYVCTV